MNDGPDIARIAALIGDPARAKMLLALMRGKALTASELSAEAGVTMPTTSAHLAKLVEGRLIAIRPEGRHKYVSLACTQVSVTLEALIALAAGTGQLRTRSIQHAAALRKARVCYNHLAGELGTDLFDSMMARGFLRGSGEQLKLTSSGVAFVSDFGIDVAALRSGRAPLCRECLGWSERRPHLAGSLGRALLARIEALGWATREPDCRVVQFSAAGEAAFRRHFGIPAPAPEAAFAAFSGIADPVDIA